MERQGGADASPCRITVEPTEPGGVLSAGETDSIPARAGFVACCRAVAGGCGIRDLSGLSLAPPRPSGIARQRALDRVDVGPSEEIHVDQEWVELMDRDALLEVFEQWRGLTIRVEDPGRESAE